MKFLKKAAFCYVAPLLSVLSLGTSPLEAQCCDPAPCSIDWCSLLVPALVGAAAGAAAGAAVSNRGKHGKKGERGAQGDDGPQGPCGHRGPEGDNPFTRDCTHSLTFGFQIDSLYFDNCSSSSSSSSSSRSSWDSGDFITPYVCTPDGRIFTGAPFYFESGSSSADTGITIPTPVFGEYVFGLEVPQHHNGVHIEFQVEATPSDGRATTRYSGKAHLQSSCDHIQLPFSFTYGPIGTVPEGF